MISYDKDDYIGTIPQRHRDIFVWASTYLEPLPEVIKKKSHKPLSKRGKGKFKKDWER